MTITRVYARPGFEGESPYMRSLSEIALIMMSDSYKVGAHLGLWSAGLHVDGSY